MVHGSTPNEQAEKRGVFWDKAGAPPVLKKKFPFRLATTSYIIPAAIMPNLEFLAPYVDEVELVLFESGREDNLPSRAEIDVMNRMGKDLGLTYNVHLPADVFLGDPDPAMRSNFREIILRFYERTLPLGAEIYILHLDTRSANGGSNADRASWLGRVKESVDMLIREGVDPHLLAVENLEYALEAILPLVETFGMSYCLDIGHLLRYGHDVSDHIRQFLPRTSMVHLHGVRNGRDHLGVDWISQADWEIICKGLERYTRGISIEVFSADDLASSLRRMQDLLCRSEDAEFQENI